MWRGTLKCLFAYFGFFLCHSGGMFVLCCCCCCCMKDNASNLTWQLINSPFSITCANYPRTRWMNPSSLTLILFMYLHVQVKWQIIYYSFQYLRFVDKFFSRMKRSFSYLMNQYFGGNLNLNSSGVLLSLFLHWLCRNRSRSRCNPVSFFCFTSYLIFKFVFFR